MFDKLRSLKTALYHIKAGSDTFETYYTYLDAEMKTSSKGQYVRGAVNELGNYERGNFYKKEAGYIYSKRDVILLQGQIDNLIYEISYNFPRRAAAHRSGLPASPSLSSDDSTHNV